MPSERIDRWIAAHSCPRCGSDVHIDVTTIDEGQGREVEYCLDSQCEYRLFQWHPAEEHWPEIRRAVVAVADLVRRGEPLPERRPA